MAEEIHDLAVKLSPDGAQETTDALEQTQDTFEETASTAEDESSRLETFAGKWKGAMGAILGGLAVAAAGLLSRVPVIGESMGGLEAIIDSIALKIDEKLRPSMSEFNQELFELADKTARAEGPLEALDMAYQGLDDAIDGLISKNIVGWIEDLTGISVDERTIEFYLDILTLDFYDVVETVKDRLGEIEMPELKLPDVKADEWVTDIEETVTDGFDRMFDTAVETGVQGINGLIGAAEAGSNTVVDTVNVVLERVTNGINSVIRKVNRFSNLTGVSFDEVSFDRLERVQFDRLESPSSSPGRSARASASNTIQQTSQDARKELEQLVQAMQTTDVEIPLSIDSREVARQTRPLMGEGAANRGRGGRGV